MNDSWKLINYVQTGFDESKRREKPHTMNTIRVSQGISVTYNGTFSRREVKSGSPRNQL